MWATNGITIAPIVANNIQKINVTPHSDRESASIVFSNEGEFGAYAEFCSLTNVSSTESSSGSRIENVGWCMPSVWFIWKQLSVKNETDSQAGHIQKYAKNDVQNQEILDDFGAQRCHYSPVHPVAQEPNGKNYTIQAIYFRRDGSFVRLSRRAQ